jgi:hypothetical protein
VIARAVHDDGDWAVNLSDGGAESLKPLVELPRVEVAVVLVLDVLGLLAQPLALSLAVVSLGRLELDE